MENNIKIARQLIRIAKLLVAADSDVKDKNVNINELITELKNNKSSLNNKKNKKFQKFGLKGQLGTMTVSQVLKELVSISQQ